MAMEEKPNLLVRIKSFVKEVQIERKKVTWPTRGELYGSTAVVVAVTLALSVVLGAFDSVFGAIMQLLLTLGA